MKRDKTAGSIIHSPFFIANIIHFFLISSISMFFVFRFYHSIQSILR